MTRDQVREMVLRHTVEAIPELQDVGIDPDKSYEELGLDSLALLQILTASTKEMKVKIPRDELVGVRSLNVLVDALFRAQKGATA